MRTIEEKAEYKIAALSPPSGLSVAELAVGATETTAKVQVTAAEDAALGLFTVGLVARTSKPKGFPVAAALIAAEVVRPASLEWAAKEVVIERGAKVELKGKVARVAPFAKKVVVRLDGLPAGVTAEPVEVAADASEFTVTLKATADATPTAAQAKAVLTFKVGDKERSRRGGAPESESTRQVIRPPNSARFSFALHTGSRADPGVRGSCRACQRGSAGASHSHPQHKSVCNSNANRATGGSVRPARA